MPDIHVRRKDHNLIPADKKALEQILKLGEGQIVKCKFTKKRSSPHHRLFFAAIQTAYDNWPEDHAEQFENKEELRGWLLCKAGYHDCIKLELDHPDYASKCAEMFSVFIQKAFGQRNIFFKSHNSLLVGFVPQSIAWDKMEQSEFTDLTQKVSDVLNAECNMSLEDFKKERAA
ncbi:MAG: hypothetical protein DHS20C07_18900 [Methyloligella sp.]|nr:MAG: hypothetical protein DHS20C07_18900 [Methyloligella sp.]